MELPLLGECAGSCAIFDGSYLKTTASVVGYTAVVEYQSKGGIFTEGLQRGVISSLRNAAEDYRVEQNDKRYLCVHLKTRDDEPNQVAVFVHGFISQLTDSGLLENLKLRIDLSMTVVTKITGRMIEQAMIHSEIDLGSPNRNAQDWLELEPSESEEGRCGGNEVYFGAISNCYHHDARGVLLAHECKKSTCFVNGTIKAVFFPKKCPRGICTIFEDKTFCSDFTIVASNGAEFPCHKVILAAKTPVFARMFGIDMKESRSNRLEMKDKSEEIVKVLLDFIYEEDIKILTLSSLTSLELLQIGHQYEVTSIETALQNMMLAKPTEWFEDEVAFELFLFTRNVEGFKDLKMKAVEVIKAKSKDITEVQFEQFVEFFKQDPHAALELVRHVAAS